MKVHVYSKCHKWWSLRHGSRAGNGTALTLRHATSRIGLKHESEWLKSILVKSNNNWQVILVSLRSPLHDIPRKFVFSPRLRFFHIDSPPFTECHFSRLSYPVRSRIKIHGSLISSGKNNCDIDPRRKSKDATLKKRKLDLKQQKMIAALNMR